MISRRGFMQIIMGAVASGTLFTSKEVEAIILTAPQEDKYAATVRLCRETLNVWEIVKPVKEAAGSYKAWSKTAECEQFLSISEHLLGHVTDSFTPRPDDADAVSALFSGYLNVDIMDENALRLVGETVTPIAVARAMIAFHKLPWDTQRMRNFDSFASKFRAAIMGDYGTETEEYRLREKAIRDRKNSDEEIQAKLKAELTEWLVSKSRPSLII